MGENKGKYRYLILSITISLLLILILLIIITKPNSTEEIKSEPINKVVINDSEEINKKLLIKNEDKNVSINEKKIIKDDSLRKGKSNNSKVVDDLKEGSAITIIEESDDGWCKVQYNNHQGYIHSTSIEGN